MSLRYLLFCAVMIAVATAFADKKGKHKGSAVEQIYDLPVPDGLPSVPLPDRPLPRVAEIHPLIRHTVAQQKGIDVSHYQGRINWEEVAQEDNVKFVYIKATEGAGFVDEFYLRNRLAYITSSVLRQVQWCNWRTSA